MLERFNNELRWRERVVGTFPNQASALRQITAMAVEKVEDWPEGKRYLSPALLVQGRRRTAS
ncbi:MAG: transposase [Calditrichaeota bacterium]|nr:transposase [Calditrichota bacterium]MCB9472800.1 transposase [Candidatus Delongbacteria bacterium]